MPSLPGAELRARVRVSVRSPVSDEGPRNVGVASVGEADISSCESLPVFQMTRLLSRWQAESSGISQVSVIWGLVCQASGDGTEPRVRLRA